MENLLNYNDFINENNSDDNRINEGKTADVEAFSNYVKYHNEVWPGYNIPKRYIGKGKYKYRVLAREGDKVKPINFGATQVKSKPLNKLNKKYWDQLSYYR